VRISASKRIVAAVAAIADGERGMRRHPYSGRSTIKLLNASITGALTPSGSVLNTQRKDVCNRDSMCVKAVMCYNCMQAIGARQRNWCTQQDSSGEAGSAWV
jgi:hypothetical protein